MINPHIVRSGKFRASSTVPHPTTKWIAMSANTSVDTCSAVEAGAGPGFTACIISTASSSIASSPLSGIMVHGGLYWKGALVPETE
jgi:hypothetical protein